MKEINLELVNRIVREVIKALSNGQEIKQKSKKITAVFTGGRIDYDKSLSQLELINNRFNIEWQLIFSDAAENILDTQLIAEKLGAEVVEASKAITSIDERDLVIVPVLTMNSAAKLASHFLDNNLLYFIFKSLILGIPVAAVKNAADLSGAGWQSFGIDKLPQTILKDNQNHLKRLKSYGVNLVDSEELLNTVLNIFENYSLKADINESASEISSEENIVKPSLLEKGAKDELNHNSVVLQKKVISYREINPIAENVNTVYVREDAVITPYARDVAENKGMIICTQQK